MKKENFIGILVLIFCVSVIIGVVIYERDKLSNTAEKVNKTDEINSYNNMLSIKLEDIFNKKGEYYVYFYSSDCKYCKNVSKYLDDFAENTNVYMFNKEETDTFVEYDWESHNKKYMKEIGKIDVNGESIYNDEYNTSNITDIFSPLVYEITIADEEFVNLNKGVELNKIYAVNVNPIINCNEYKKGNIIIPGVPYLLCLKDGKVVNYYTGDLQILNFLGIDYTGYLEKDIK